MRGPDGKKRRVFATARCDADQLKKSSYLPTEFRFLQIASKVSARDIERNRTFERKILKGIKRFCSGVLGLPKGTLTVELIS